MVVIFGRRYNLNVPKNRNDDGSGVKSIWHTFWSTAINNQYENVHFLSVKNWIYAFYIAKVGKVPVRW